MTKYLDDWARSLLCDPISKSPVSFDFFKTVNGVADARVFLKNTFGYNEWFIGQDKYESWWASGSGYENKVKAYRDEVNYDRPVYEHFKLTGDILDVGGGLGTVREFLGQNARFISIDPFIGAPFCIPDAKSEAYHCLSRDFNFIGGMAEFLPFRSNSFDWVHMRSMLDHVQVPDLALIEAFRVLKPGGSLLVGLLCEGGKSGKKSTTRFIKDCIKHVLEFLGIEKYKDFHTWHPSYSNLLQLIGENGFKITESYWQPYWVDQVVYVLAKKI